MSIAFRRMPRIVVFQADVHATIEHALSESVQGLFLRFPGFFK